MIAGLDILARPGKAIQRAAIGLALAVILGALYYVLAVRPDLARAEGAQHGQAKCVAAGASQAVTAVVAAATSAASKANDDIAKGQALGAQHEQVRTRIVTLYRTLDQEASHDQPHPVDACVLPDDRLQRWAAANAGPVGTAAPADQSSSPGQPDQAASAPADAPLGAHAGSGGGSPDSGRGLPSPGGPDVRPPEASGD